MSMFQFSGRSVSATVCLLVLLAGSGCGGDKEVVAGPADATSSSPDTGELDSQIVSDVPVAVDTQPVDTSVPDVKSACEKQSDCPEQQCDVLTGQCVACLFDYHCDKGLTCLAQTCEKPTPCLGDKVCLSKGGVCNLEANACVDCNGDADCGEGTVCKLNSCVPASKACKSSKDCAELDQVCDQQSGSCVDCQLDTDCSAETYCADGMCIPDICTKGQTKCKSVTVLQVCNGAGSAYNDLECEADAEACDEGECKKVICQPGEKVCDGVYVKECSARGVDLSISASCTADETCQSGSCLPHICDPGEQKCSSKGVATCADDGLSWVDSLCSSKETCVADAGAATAKCEPHICTPNLPTCDGNAYSICSDDGLNKKIINDCTKLSDGGPGVCLSGACVANSCNAGDKGCAGLATTTCVAGKWQTKSCGPKETCAAGKCVPVSCVPKEIYCDLNVIKLCSPNGDTAKFVKDCASESKPGKPRGCKGGICVDLDCMPGATSCSADNNSVETCKATGFGKVAQQCAAQQTCVTGACKALICTSGQVYCKGNDVMKCDATGTATQKLSTCPKGKICGKGACLNQLCNPGQTQCGDIFGANAGKLETCSADGMAWNASPCASGSACDDGSCKTVICKPTSSICQGSDVMQCNAVGTSFVKKQTCLKTQVCNEGACKTPICKKGVSTCGAGAQSGKLLTCAQSELAWLESSCPAGTICYGGGCKQVLCKMGELGCQGTKQVSCGNNGTSWVPKVDCATNKQVCSEGACKSPICSKGSSSCGVGTQAGALLTCSADQLKWLESKCPVGTTCFSGACKQVVCSMGENSCVGDSVVTCADDGTSWTPSTDCAANKQTCVGGICKSKQCKAGEVQCAGTTVITCNTTGTGWVTQNCSDNNACTPDTCKDGKCQYGASKVCDDKDPCTNDACNVITGQCVTSPASGNCDDGLKCTQGEVCQAGKCQPYEWDLVGTVAGSGTSGFQDGAGTSAKFNNPGGVAADEKGGIYVADYDNHRIRYISPSKQVTTVAGSGTKGLTEGAASSARFYHPYDVIWDVKAQTLYVSDAYNYRIRKFKDGQVSTLVGGGKGYAEGSGTVAKFNIPFGMALAPDGTLFVVDHSNHIIRKVQGGKSSLVAGVPGKSGTTNGAAAVAKFKYPQGVAVLPSGGLIIADRDNNRLRRISTAGVVTTLATGFNKPRDVIYYGPYLAVSDGDYHRIRRVTLTGQVTLLAGTGSAAFADNFNPLYAKFRKPHGLTLGAGGEIYVADWDNHRIRAIIPGTKSCSDGKACTADSCDKATGDCVFKPISQGQSCDDGNACTTGEKCDQAGSCAGGKSKSCSDNNPCTDDECNPVTAVCTSSAHTNDCSDGNACTLGDACKDSKCQGGFGLIQTIIGTGENTVVDGAQKDARIGRPEALSMAPDGSLWWVNNHQVRRMDAKGTVVTLAGTTSWGFQDGKGSQARFRDPRGIAATSGGFAFVADTTNRRVRRVSATGVVTTLAGDGQTGYVDGQGLSARFGEIRGMAATADGVMYIADKSNQRIRKVTANGLVSTFAGSGSYNYLDGAGTSAAFRDPYDVALDKAGNVYVADRKNHRIRKITQQGLVTTVAGSGSAASADGPVSSAKFYYPSDVEVLASGELIVRAGTRFAKVGGGLVTTIIDNSTGSSNATDDGGLHVASIYNSSYGLEVDSSGRVWFGQAGRIRRLDFGTIACDDFSACTTDSCDPVKGGCQYVPLKVGSVCDDGDACTTATLCDAKGACKGATKNCDDGNLCTKDSCDPFLGLCSNESTIDPCDDGDACTPKEVCFEGTCSANLRLVETLAGSGTSKSAVDGKGAAASLGRVLGATWKGDELYFTEYDNYKVRKVTLDGTVTTVAGTGDSGFKNGPASSAKFGRLYEIDALFEGSLVVVDHTHHRIRRIHPNGQVTTLAGSGSEGYLDGSAATAKFRYPIGVAGTANGDVYVGDYENHRIRLITNNGQVITAAGSGSYGYLDGPASSAKFAKPRGVAVGKQGEVYVADSDNRRIRRILQGQVSTIAGNGSNGFSSGVATSSPIGWTEFVAVDSNGLLWASSYDSHLVARVKAGQINVMYGTGSKSYLDGVGTAAKFNHPRAIAWHPGGHFAIFDTESTRIRLVRDNTKVCDDSKPCTTDSCDAKTGKCVATPAQVGFACDDDQLCTAGTSCDAKGQCVGPKISCDDKNVCTIDSCDPLSATNCSNLPVDSGLGLVCDDGDACTTGESCWDGKCQSTIGLVTTVAGTGTKGMGDGDALASKFHEPSDVVFGLKGEMYVADRYNHRIRKIEKGKVTTFSGTGSAGYVDGKVDAAQFNQPRSLAVSKSGSLALWDGNNRRLRTVAPDGTVGTLAGTGSDGYQDGVGSSAKFRCNGGLAFDAKQALIMADTYNHRIRIIQPDGNSGTVAGSGSAGFQDGALTSAKFNQPWDVAVTPSGSIIVADWANRRIRRVGGGQVVTIAGSGSYGKNDGNASTATFREPRSLALAPNGDLFIGDWPNTSYIRRLRGQQVLTVAGGGSGNASGIGTAAHINYAIAMDVSPDGLLVYADAYMHKIRRLLNPETFCDDGDACTQDVCDPKTGKCAFTAAADGVKCDVDALCQSGGTCQQGECTGGVKLNAKKICGLDSFCYEGQCAGVATCKNRCGNYQAGAACQCDSQCAQQNDCCSDFKQLCPVLPLPPGPPGP